MPFNHPTSTKDAGEFQSVRDKRGREYQLIITPWETKGRIHPYEVRAIFIQGRFLFKPIVAKATVQKLRNNAIIFAHLEVNRLFRRRGLGSTLVEEVKELYKREPEQLLRGIVTQTDIDKASFLFRWYRDLGFQIHNTPEDILRISEWCKKKGLPLVKYGAVAGYISLEE